MGLGDVGDVASSCLMCLHGQAVERFDREKLESCLHGGWKYVDAVDAVDGWSLMCSPDQSVDLFVAGAAVFAEKLVRQAVDRCHYYYFCSHAPQIERQTDVLSALGHCEPRWSYEEALEIIVSIVSSRLCFQYICARCYLQWSVCEGHRLFIDWLQRHALLTPGIVSTFGLDMLKIRDV